jgi:transcriptional regulator with XRE-family HTH domain
MTGAPKRTAATKSATPSRTRSPEAEDPRIVDCLLHRHDGPIARGRSGTPPPPIGGKLRQLRKRKGLTLGDVEEVSGISKSMLSQIERGRVNPTFATLWNLTRSLEIGIGELLDEVSSAGENIRRFEHVEIHSTPVITSSDGLVETRILSPRRYPLAVEWYELLVKPGGVLRANAHGNGEWEHTTAISGSVIVEIGDEDLVLQTGETVRYAADQPHGVRNESKEDARLFLVVVPLPGMEHEE